MKQLVRVREQLLREAEDEAAAVRGELGGAVKYQQIAEDLMGDLDKAKAEAEEARSQSEATFQEASDIYAALQGNTPQLLSNLGGDHLSN